MRSWTPPWSRPPAKGDQSTTQSAGCTRAGQVANRHPQVAFHDRREVCQVTIQLQNHRGGRSLLRAVNGRGALWSAKRVGHVAGDGDLRQVELGSSPGRVNPCQPGELAAAWPELAAVSVEQSEAKGLAKARPSVVGGAAADPHDHAPRPSLEGREQELTGSPGGRSQGISQRSGNK